MTTELSSLMLLSGITPAVLFSYLGIEKYGKKKFVIGSESALPFNLGLYRILLEAHIKQYINNQLREQVTLTVGREQLRGYIRQRHKDIFTFYINYHSPLISLQQVEANWIVIWENEEPNEKLVLPFIMTLENKLFS